MVFGAREEVAVNAEVGISVVLPLSSSTTWATASIFRKIEIQTSALNLHNYSIVTRRNRIKRLYIREMPVR